MRIHFTVDSYGSFSDGIIKKSFCALVCEACHVRSVESNEETETDTDAASISSLTFFQNGGLTGTTLITPPSSSVAPWHLTGELSQCA